MAQNLVPNPGFELIPVCDENFINSSLEKTENWFNAVDPLSTVDLYSSCFCPISGSLFCPPNLYYGNGNPYEGQSMIGMGIYSENTQKGEAFGIKLSEPLLRDSAYCFGFWIKNSKNHGSTYSMKNIDIAFVIDTTGIDHKSQIADYKSIINSNDNGDWQYLSSYYIAKGGEQFFLVGSFDVTPDYFFYSSTPTSSKFLYYYFDEFSVYACSKDLLFSVTCNLPNVFTVNNDNINEQYLIQQKNIVKLDVEVFNRWGNIVKTYDGITENWDGSDNNGTPLTEGVYFVKVIAETTFGEILNKQQFVHLITK